MSADFDSMQSVKFLYDTPTHRGWVHNSVLTYTLCATVIVMSCVALFINATKVEQTQRSAKHHP